DCDALVHEAHEILNRYGFTSVKVKGGVLPPEEEIEAVQALRSSLGGQVALRIDPNGAWSIATSVHVAKALAGVLEYLEDPTPGMGAMEELSRTLKQLGITLPLATNMAVDSFTTLFEAAQRDASQIVLCDHHYWGGLRESQLLGRCCEILNLGLG